MGRNILLASRLREVLLDGHWIANTNYKAIIQSVDWLESTQKVANLNSIAALTFHVNYYLVGLLNAFKTAKLEINDRYSFAMPELKSAADWDKLVGDFLQNAEDFASLIEQMDEQLFDQPFMDGKYGTVYRNIECVIEHAYYHLGQMSLLKKLIKTANS